MTRQSILILFLSLSYHFYFGQNIVINEFMASNSHVLSDNYDEFDDWIEVYNTTGTDINLAGYYFSDNPNNPYKYKIPATNPIFTTVAAGGYLVFWADGDTLQGPTHLGFKISSAGEAIILTNPQGIIEDEIEFLEQESNVSASRIPNGVGPFYFCPEATPYSLNNTIGYNGFVKSNPVFSIKRGVYESSQSLELTKDFVSGEIRYTTDGKEPNLSSQIYSTPIDITQNTTIRAAVFQDSLVPSEVKTHSYIFDVIANQEIPVISITGDSLLFYDNATGLFTQSFLPTWEYKVNFEIIDVVSGEDKSQELGVEILQEDGWQLPQKPLNFRARDVYGKKNFKYSLFPEETMTTFKSFSLRNGREDWGSTMMKDGVSQLITEDNMTLDNRFYRPSSVYINGVWQGVYNIRVNTDAQYPEKLYGYDKDSIDVIKGNNTLEGTSIVYDAWLGTLQSSDMTDSISFVNATKSMDIDSYTHHILSILFFGNQKWATENSFQWKTKGDAGKWRWFLRGMDEAMRMENIDSVLLDFVTDPIGGVNNPEWITRPIRKLLENDAYRTYFISQLADHFYITFNTVSLVNAQNEIKDVMDSYMSNHIPLWSGSSNTYVDPLSSYQSWEDSLIKVENWYSNRGSVVQSDAIAYFSEISTTSNLSLQVQTSGAGKIAINKMVVPEDMWSGVYFDSLEFTLTAIPSPGFEFVGWENSGLTDTTAASFEMMTVNDTVLVAHFQSTSTIEKSVMFTEIKAVSDTLFDVGDWVEVYNPSTNWVNLSNWTFKNNNETYNLPGNTLMAPDSYIILANDKNAFLTWYEGVYGEDVSSQVFGNYNFGLSSGGSDLRLIDDNNFVIDSVDYLANSPWPLMVNPDTVSIELVDASFQNEFGHNWFLSENYLGTPLNPSSFSFIHIGKIPSQEINTGDVFATIDLNDYVLSPNMSIDDLQLEVTGNSAISVTISAQNVASLSYSNWQGVEWIKFRVTDTLGNTSIDSAQFLVGTVLDQLPCNATYSINESPLFITEPITIQDGCVVNILEGVEVRMKANSEIVVKGELNFLGTLSDSIYLHAHVNEWNSILIDSSANTSHFNYVSIQDATNGSDSTKMNAAITGYYGSFEVNNCTFLNTYRSIYGYHGDAFVSNCKFLNSIGEKVNFQFTNASVVDCYFSPSYGDFDAIDFDAVNRGLIQGNIIVSGEDDGIDIGQIEGVVCDSLVVVENTVNGLLDKAISVGEGSTNIFIERNILTNSYYGVAVKDGSEAFIDHNTIDRNNFAIALFEKNNGLVGSYALVENSILSNSFIATTLIDLTSSAVFNYNCSNVNELEGLGNILDDPGFSQDYELEFYSSCINTGDPVFSFDDDGTQTDVGAKWFNTEEIINSLATDILVMPNPIGKGSEFLVSWKLVADSEQLVQIFDANGKIIFEKVFLPENVNQLGVQFLQINSLSIGAGVYFCRVRGGEKVLTTKFIVAP